MTGHRSTNRPSRKVVDQWYEVVGSLPEWLAQCAAVTYSSKSIQAGDVPTGVTIVLTAKRAVDVVAWKGGATGKYESYQAVEDDTARRSMELVTVAGSITACRPKERPADSDAKDKPGPVLSVFFTVLRGRERLQLRVWVGGKLIGRATVAAMDARRF